MRSTLHIKFALLYIIFAFLGVFTTATLGRQLLLNRIVATNSESLYQEANLIASNYLPSYFTDNTTSWAVHSQLNAMRIYLDASLWFVAADGTLITSSNLENTSAPEVIDAFDPAETGGKQYLTGEYHGYFNEEVMTVIAPVIQGFQTKGYLLVHQPFSALETRCSRMMIPFYITLMVLFALSFIFLLGFHYFIYRPLSLITEAATQYASGNLDYEIPVYTQDEMGYLSASLNYMSSHLRDMDDYQKKFVANVSHDFRSPLTSIKGYVEAMADGTIPPELYDKYLKIILFETERLTDLTQDLLTLNEFDNKNILLNKEVFDIHDMIKHVAASFEGTCTQKKISIEVILAAKHLNVNADKRKIQQVLYNLLDNAIKFSDPDSVITIETTERGEKVYTSIKDDGIGIPRSSLNKIWERFYKSDLSRGKDKKGTGLGLTIVKEAIQAHGENINVVSTEGVGTEFIFSLPRVNG